MRSLGSRALTHGRAAVRGVAAGAATTAVVTIVMTGVTAWAAVCVFPGSLLAGVWYACEVYATEVEKGEWDPRGTGRP